MTNPFEPKYAQMSNNKPNITVYRYVFCSIVLLPLHRVEGQKDGGDISTISENNNNDRCTLFFSFSFPLKYWHTNE